MTHPALLRDHVDVPTPDGSADSYLVRPEGDRPAPAVLLFMDAIGLRPRLVDMADRIAARGYAVLVPNLFFRAGRAPVIADVVRRLQTEERDAVFGELRPLMQALTPEVAARDTAAYVAFLEHRPGVSTTAIATVGYCFGGALALRAAAQLPDRVVAVASFHGGNLAPDDPAGPQHVLPGVHAEVYAAHADQDASMPPEQQERFEAALAAAGVPHACELYEGAAHGFTVADMPVHDPAAEARHWAALLGLLDRRLPAA